MERKTNEELVDYLNSCNILQASSWDECIPTKIWTDYFKDRHYIVAENMDVDKHRSYELSTTVVEIQDGFIGICSVTTCYSEESNIEDMNHYLKFFRMRRVNQPTYIKL